MPTPKPSPAGVPDLDPELERRITLLEQPAHQGQDFDGLAWLAFILLGVVLPVAALLWGRA